MMDGLVRLWRSQILVLGLICALLVGTSPAAWAWEINAGPLAELTEAESILYGQENGGALLARMDHIEQDLFGGVQEGALVSRLEKVKTVLTGGAGQASLVTTLSSLEWYVLRSTSTDPLAVRVVSLETVIFGKQQSGWLSSRVGNLVKSVWPGGAVTASPTTLPKGTLVKIKLLTELNSQASKVGDLVNYRTVADTKVDGKLVIPAGVTGTGKVTEVYTAGNMGRDGRVVVDFGSIKAIDGRDIRVEVAERATEMNKSLQIAAGASMAGVVLLGPVGLVGGFFIKGKNVIISIGTEFFVEVSAPVDATGVAIGG